MTRARFGRLLKSKDCLVNKSVKFECFLKFDSSGVGAPDNNKENTPTKKGTAIAMPFRFFVGMTGLEPATPRPPDVYSTI